METSARLVDILSGHATQHPDRVAYRFLATGEVGGPIATVSYGEVARHARAIGSILRRDQPPGARVLLLYPPGVEFVAGFLGCGYAGTIAVPAYLPEFARIDRSLPRLARIIADCGASAVLTTHAVRAAAERLTAIAPELAELRWLVSDAPPEPAGNSGDTAEYAADDIAFLQYTSGSTGTPKGVMVTHANLIHNLRCQRDTFEQDEHSQFVSWLPAYHDLGLIAGLLYPLLLGATATLLPPLAFLQRPLRWLEAVSHFGGTFSAAPNFAYDLCVRKSTDEDVAKLDLSSWAIAGNAAEPVRRQTLDRFAQRFAPAGFRRRSFVPGYGLAEATLFVTSGRTADLPGGSADTAYNTVSCGRPSLDTEVVIVDPETRVRTADGQTGEIWVKSLSNARGYWNRSAETQDTFHARLTDGDGPFLRTGDLGFLDNGELHVSGRIKDLVIVGGVNHYPQDLEHTVESCHPAVRSGCVTAFAIDDDSEERLIVVAEVRDSSHGQADAVVTAIRAAIAEHHQVEVHGIALIAARTIPKTSSGKLRRRESRERYRAGRLDVRHSWSATSSTRPAEEIESWLVAQLALRANIHPRRIETDRPFDSYGLVSLDAVEWSSDLGTWLGRAVPPTVMYEYPTIDALVRHLSAPEHERPGPEPVTSEPDAGRATEPIAIIGIGCRYPGAEGPTGYWSLLANEVDAIRDVPPTRWDADAYLHEGGPMPGKMYTRRGGFLDDVAGFDPAFFGMSAGEARYLDPQQRLLLEVAWEALEDGGLLPERVAGTATGVFIGITTSDYAQMQMLSGVGTGPYSATGNVFCMAANRLSYTFDLRGPSLSLDTACSSSLLAIHQACVSLRSGESELALAGGVNLMLSPDTTVALCQSGALSADGRCHTFDARANGYVRGEGAGLVLLKPLRRAIADGDRVYAVIRGSAVNQDGRSNGLTAPSPEAHARVIRQAYLNAGLSPGRMQYVEAHGTGTALGDPIEAGAIGAVLAGQLPGGAHCAVGSVKTNIGHLEPAAGVAGLTKVALALYHGELPASLHFESPNSHIDLDSLGLRVQTKLTPWPADRGTKVAGVSSFGVGGTNVHIVLEEAPTPPTVPAEHDGIRPHLLVLSARTPAALSALAARFSDSLPDASASIDAVCHTAALRRTHHEHRLAVVARSKTELAARLAQAGTGATGVRGRAEKGRRARLVFVFPGQGPQYLGMGRRLYATHPAFRTPFDNCAQAMQPHLDWSVLGEFLADETTSQLDRDEVVQPLLFAIQVSLASTWRAWGVSPDAVVGHSMGEVAAAHVAGALTLADAARITCLRANHLAVLRGQGAMAVVALSRHELGAELAGYGDRLHLAASNGPSLSVVSGDAEALADLQRTLESRDIFCRRIKAGGAGHSPVVDPAARAVAAELTELRPTATRVPMYSSVTGALVAGEDLDGGYWARNLRDPVLFCPAIEQLAEDGYDLYLELSPNPTLAIPIQQTLDDRGRPGHAFGSLARKRDDQEALLEALGTAYVHGAAVDFARIHDAARPVTSLPSGPWQREHCWFADTPGGPAGRPPAHPVERAASVSDTVATAFSNVLRVHPVGPDDSFFELGGTSLMAAQMLYELRSALRCEIPLRLLFDHPTIASFTDALEAHQAAPGVMSTPALVRTQAADFPLTHNQEMLLAQERRGVHRGSLVVAQHILLEGPLDVAVLEAAVRRVIDIHDGLRTVFADVGDGGGVRQSLSQGLAVNLTVTDLSTGHEDVEAALRTCLAQAERGFTPSEGPLHRFELIRLAEDRHVLSIVLPHLITDGWSQGVLFGDLVRAYEARLAGRDDGLVSPPVRLVDFAHWQRGVYSGVLLEERMGYWSRELRRTHEPQLRFVRPQTAMPATVGGHSTARFFEADIDEALHARLEEAARSAATTLPMTILAGFLLALRMHSGQDTVTVPTTASTRDRPDLERVVGYLSQSRLVTVDFSGGPTRRECLTRVRDAVLQAGEEQGLALNHYLHLQGLLPEDEPFRVSMNYLPDVDLPTHLGEARATLLPRQGEYSLSRDIVMVVRHVERGLRLSCGYQSAVVDDDGMAQFTADLIALLEELAVDPDGALPQPDFPKTQS